MSISSHPGKPRLVIGISGSPGAVSSTALLLDEVLGRLQTQGLRTRHLKLRDLPAGPLVAGAAGAPEIAAALSEVAGAEGVIIATPIYKGAYSGLLKLFLDLMPQFGLAGKAVFPLATGGSLAHALALDYALRPVLQSMGARHVIQSLLVPAGGMRQREGEIELEAEIARPLNEALQHFAAALLGGSEDGLWGHPRPDRAGQATTAG